MSLFYRFSFFFFNVTAPTEIYTLSYTTLFRSPCTRRCRAPAPLAVPCPSPPCSPRGSRRRDRKSTRLNSSHRCISYAVFCLKKKKKKKKKADATKKHKQKHNKRKKRRKSHGHR